MPSYLSGNKKLLFFVTTSQNQSPFPKQNPPCGRPSTAPPALGRLRQRSGAAAYLSFSAPLRPSVAPVLAPQDIALLAAGRFRSFGWCRYAQRPQAWRRSCSAAGRCLEEGVGAAKKQPWVVGWWQVGSARATAYLVTMLFILAFCQKKKLNGVHGSVQLHI